MPVPRCIECGETARHAVAKGTSLELKCCPHYLEGGGKPSTKRDGDRASHDCA